MNGKLIETKITKKNVELRHHEMVKMEFSHTNIGGKDRYGNPGTALNSRSLTSYQAYTETSIEFTDLEDNEVYDLTIVFDDFLPTLDSSIKIYVNDDREVLAYQPYKTAEPIFVRHNLHNYSMKYLAKSFINHLSLGIPWFSLINTYGIRSSFKRYKDGVLSDRLILNVLLIVFFLSFQFYYTYFLYDQGRKYFWEAMYGFGMGGLIVACAITVNNVVNLMNFKDFKSMIKRKFKESI